jgi:hypothetical protein
VIAAISVRWTGHVVGEDGGQAAMAGGGAIKEREGAAGGWGGGGGMDDRMEWRVYCDGACS